MILIWPRQKKKTKVERSKVTLSSSGGMAESVSRVGVKRAVEFYAGIGGFHCALNLSGISKCKVVASIDINTNTTRIYSHNFPETKHLNRNICGLTAEELDALDADVFFLSPPCQPFTRQGNQLDDKDRRTDSFFHLMRTLQEMRSPPRYLLMENVKGFETSHTRGQFVSILKSLGYETQEFLLSPNQFGIPNSRLRFYLLAKRRPLQFARQCNGGEENSGPSRDAGMLIDFVGGRADLCLADLERLEREHDSSKGPILGPALEVDTAGDGGGEPGHTNGPCRPLSDYLEDLDEDSLQRFLVPDKILQKYAKALDIVEPGSTHSCCFTKAYGNYAVGTGSVLQHSLDRAALDTAFRSLSEQRGGDLEGSSVECLRPLNLRYFTPKEVANLMCFPKEYGFPSGLSDKQCYKALGNSLNVRVVSILINYLLS